MLYVYVKSSIMDVQILYNSVNVYFLPPYWVLITVLESILRTHPHVDASQISFKGHVLPFSFSCITFLSHWDILVAIPQCCISINTFFGNATSPVNHFPQSQYLQELKSEIMRQDLQNITTFLETAFCGLCLANPSVHYQRHSNQVIMFCS